jgi:hypothetical protein
MLLTFSPVRHSEDKRELIFAHNTGGTVSKDLQCIARHLLIGDPAGSKMALLSAASFTTSAAD